MRFILLLLSLVLIGTSCEDKKTPPKESETAVEVVKKENVAVTKDKDSIDLEGTIKNPMIASQEQVIDFLTTYGEENPETKVLITTRFGDIEVTLFEDTPLHRANFIMLVKRGYFNTTQFHRVSPNFVVQGGNNDTQTTAKNRARIGSYLIPNEASSRHTHVRGAFSSAKYAEQNVSNATAPFEFFIVQPARGAHHLDGDHTVFGKVTRGMDVVDKINQLEVDGSEWPLENVYMKIKILD